MEDGMPRETEPYRGGSHLQRVISSLKVCIVCGFAPDQLVCQVQEALDKADIGKWMFYDAKAKYQDEVITKGLQGRRTRKDRLSSVEEALWKFMCAVSEEGNNVLIDCRWVPEAGHVFHRLECKLNRKKIVIFWLQGIFHDGESYQQEMRLARLSTDYRLCFANHVREGSVWSFQQEKDKDCLLYKRKSEGWEDEFFTVEGRDNGVRTCVAFLRSY